jgi:hypothetical protein
MTFEGPRVEGSAKRITLRRSWNIVVVETEGHEDYSHVASTVIYKKSKGKIFQISHLTWLLVH